MSKQVVLAVCVKCKCKISAKRMEYCSACGCKCEFPVVPDEELDEAEHSPLPWKVSGDRVGWYGIEDAQGEDIGYLYSSDGADESKPYPDKANAELIVNAVNAVNTHCSSEVVDTQAESAAAEIYNLDDNVSPQEWTANVKAIIVSVFTAEEGRHGQL